MKKIIAVIGVAALLATINVKASVVQLNGNTVTNANAAYNSGTNTSGVVTNNFQNGVVPGASNVFYALSTTYGAQPGRGTNGFLPALSFSALGGFPGSLNAPTRNISIEVGGALMATNATSTAIAFRFAASDSGVNWATNYQNIILTVPVNSTQAASGCVLTNMDTGGTAYINLQQIENPGVAALTNIVINITGKSGL